MIRDLELKVIHLVTKTATECCLEVWTITRELVEDIKRNLTKEEIEEFIKALRGE